MCREELDESYFSDIPCKVIYKSLSSYYKKYGSVPGLNECLVTIDNCWYATVGAPLDEVKDVCCRLYSFEEPDETFIKDKITGFIRQVRSTVKFQEFLRTVKDNGSALDGSEIVQSLVDALDIQLADQKIFDMTNMDQVREARMSAVGSEDSSKVIPSYLDTLNKNLMFGGWQPSTVNMVVAPPGTGKSMLLINEGVNAAKRGFKVLHIFIGDMVEYDGFIRYVSCLSGYPQSTLVMQPPEKQAETAKLCNQQYNDALSNIRILAYPSLSISVDRMSEDIVRFEKQLMMDFDMIIVDYPDNLIQEGKSLYEDGGTLYSSLEKLARLTKSVMLVASQPKQTYWSHEIIPLEGAAESSKKQMAVDVMLCLNTTDRTSNVGSFHLAKARKGTVGKVWRFKTDFARCRLEEISESVYNASKDASKGET